MNTYQRKHERRRRVMGVRMSRFDLDHPMTQGEKLEMLLKLKSKCRITDNDCWMWLMFKNKLGYGNTTIKNKNWMTHRLTWVLTNGRIPEGKFVCHHCDNPACINPDHLFLGDHTENQRDMVAKGRHAKGKKTHCKRGHDLREFGRRYETGHRQCLLCNRIKNRLKAGWTMEQAASMPLTPHGYRVVKQYPNSAGDR